MSDSDSSVETRKLNIKKGRTAKRNSELVCTICKKLHKTVSALRVHIQRCERRNISVNLTCKWCGVLFVNRGNLASHAFHIHGDSSYKSAITLDKEKYGIKCSVCNIYFSSEFLLRAHIRKLHFNLKGLLPCAEIKKVNQVWFERVQNTNKLVEIKKISSNCLVIQKIEYNAAIKVQQPNRRVDLTKLYPVTHDKNRKQPCSYCDKILLKRDLKKHIDEVHFNKAKHSCNNCNRTFKRSYQYLQHNCGRSFRIRGVKQTSSEQFVIARVESLVPLVA